MTPHPNHLYHYHGQVARIVDGDTLDIVVDLGFRISQKMRFRITGERPFDAPEVRGVEKVAGRVAERWVSDYLQESDGKVYIRTDHEKGKFGRYICRVWRAGEDPGVVKDMAQRMVEEGHGRWCGE